MKKILFIITLTFLIMPCAGQAGFLADGFHQVEVCNKIVNTSKFFAYNFYYASIQDEGLKAIEPDQCLQFYNLSWPRIYAIKKSNITKLEDDLIAAGDLSLNNIVTSNYVLKSDLALEGDKPVSDKDPLIAIENHYKIISIGESVRVGKYKQIDTFKDGTTKEQVFDLDKVNGNGAGLWTYLKDYWYYYLILFGLFIIIILFIRKRKKIRRKNGRRRL